MNDDHPELAAIVLSVGAPPELRCAVESLLAQTIPVEILVVNSGGGDPESRLTGLGRSVAILSVPERLWPGAARNLGIHATHAPWIAFLASDLVAAPDWTANRLALHKQGYQSVASAVVNSHPGNLFAWASHLSILAGRLPGVSHRKADRHGASYARALFKHYGLFRSDLRIGEDTEFNRRLVRKDRPVWAPSVQATHLNPTRFLPMLTDQFARGHRLAIHWPTADTQGIVQRCWNRLSYIVRISYRAVRGRERLFVIASWPLLTTCVISYELGVSKGRRECAHSGAVRFAAMAVLDGDGPDARAIFIVIADATCRHLILVPSNARVPGMGGSIGTAYATGEEALLLRSLRRLEAKLEGLVCLSARTMNPPEAGDATSPDDCAPFPPHLPALENARILAPAIAAFGARVNRIMESPGFWKTAGEDPRPVLRKIEPDWHVVVFSARKKKPTKPGKSTNRRSTVQTPIPPK